MIAARPVIATMDGDGQNDPADIMRLVSRLGREGGEPALVGGIREGRKAKGSRKAASRFANWIRDKVLADGCPDTGCGLKIYRRDAYLEVPYFTSMHRYLPAMFLTYGHEIAYEPVNDRPRLRGASKYTNFGRALVGLYDLIGVSWLRKRTRSRRSPKFVGGGYRPWRGSQQAKSKWRPSRNDIGTSGKFGGHRLRAPSPIWITIGFMAQFMFSMRFIVQWIATEKARASIIP